MLRVLTLSTLFPDETRPNFGLFVARQTAALAARDGIAVRVVAPIGLPPGPLAHAGPYQRFRQVPVKGEIAGLTVDRPRFTVLPGTGGRFHVSALIRALVPVLDRLRSDFPFDVIDAEFFFPDGPAAIALGARYDVPVSIKARGADIHHWGYGATAAAVRRAGWAADGMLAVSTAMRDDMIALGFPAERIAVHHTGVDLDRFRPADRSAAKRALGVTGSLVVSVGALIARKGHDVLIDAVAGLPDTTLLIAGEGPDRDALSARIDALGVRSRVCLLGSVANDELPALYAAADAMALASASEGLANAWVEALACGTPIVITDIGGARDLGTAEGTVSLVPRSAGAFRAALSTVLAASPPAAAARKIAERFTWSANAAALDRHLRDLVSARQPQRRRA